MPETTEDVFEQPQEAPGYVGTLQPEEQQQLSGLQRNAQQLMLRIGQLETEKAAMIENLRQGERLARNVMDQFAERVGVDHGQDWTVNPDGKVYVGVSRFGSPGGNRD